MIGWRFKMDIIWMTIAGGVIGGLVGLIITITNKKK